MITSVYNNTMGAWAWFNRWLQCLCSRAATPRMYPCTLGCWWLPEPSRYDYQAIIHRSHAHFFWVPCLMFDSNFAMSSTFCRQNMRAFSSSMQLLSTGTPFWPHVYMLNRAHETLTICIQVHVHTTLRNMTTTLTLRIRLWSRAQKSDHVHRSLTKCIEVWPRA